MIKPLRRPNVRSTAEIQQTLDDIVRAFNELLLLKTVSFFVWEGDVSAADKTIRHDLGRVPTVIELEWASMPVSIAAGAASAADGFRDVTVRASGSARVRLRIA